MILVNMTACAVNEDQERQFSEVVDFADLGEEFSSVHSQHVQCSDILCEIVELVSKTMSLMEEAQLKFIGKNVKFLLPVSSPAFMWVLAKNWNLGDVVFSHSLRQFHDDPATDRKILIFKHIKFIEPPF